MYQEKDYNSLLGLAGFSDNLLQTHFKLYQGYVKNTNTLLENFKTAEVGTPQYAEMKRRFGWEFDGMRLHELYFDNLIKDAAGVVGATSIKKAIERDFGSFARWQKDFEAVATLRGIGWAILYYDQDAKKLFNVWINEHDAGHLVGAKPLLVCDVFEHAFVLDYGMARADYLKSFFKAINWPVVAQ